MFELGLENYLASFLYVSAIVAVVLALFWRPAVGIFYLAPLIPLQTIRYRMNEFPLGSSVIYIVLAAVALGLLRRGKPILPRTPWNIPLFLYVGYTFVSLCMGSFFLDTPLPLWPGDARLSVWADYMTMPALLLLTASAVEDRRLVKGLVLLMCLSTLVLDRNFYSAVSGRDFSTFSDDLREDGNMGYAGVNGLAAFEAQFAVLLLALAAFERSRWLKWTYTALAGYSAVCLMYALSRGAYAAFLAGCLFLGLTKRPFLLVLLAVFASTWATIVPNAVKSRVETTYDESSGELEHSAEVRIELWRDAEDLIRTSPAVGTGFNTYAYMSRLYNYADTHNYYLKVLVETGVIGLLLFLWLLAKTFRQGFRLFRRSRDPFLASLGLGLAGWVVAAAVSNCFGDRWTYFQVNGYMWILCGLASRAFQLEQNEAQVAAEVNQTSGVLPLQEEPAGAI